MTVEEAWPSALQPHFWDHNLTGCYVADRKSRIIFNEENYHTVGTISKLTSYPEANSHTAIVYIDLRAYLFILQMYTTAHWNKSRLIDNGTFF